MGFTGFAQKVSSAQKRGVLHKKAQNFFIEKTNETYFVFL